VREDWAVLEALDGARSEIERSALDLEAVMTLICETALGLTGADAVAVDLVEGEELVVCAVAGDGFSYVGKRLGLGNSLAGQCVRVGHPVRCGDPLHDPRVDFRFLSLTRHESVVCVPLIHYELPIGVLKAGAARPDAFGDRSTAVLSLLADVIVAHLS
jgi:GAF domain-containing protein